MELFKKLKYTYNHRKAFKAIERHYFGKKSYLWVTHDLEKYLLYLIFGVKLGSNIHRKFSRHHVNSIRKNKKYKEMVIDWECARYSKPDKPLNAYETLMLYYPQVTNKIMLILIKLDINKKTSEVAKVNVNLKEVKIII
jgi:uncharacterized protein YfbU (UPF0304 family)